MLRYLIVLCIFASLNSKVLISQLNITIMKKLLFLLPLLLSAYVSFAQGMDNDEISEYIESQRVKEICGIPFGTSYEEASNSLYNKYGSPEYNINNSKESITYKNKKYAGILFDTIYFLFQSDGRRSYMNGCVFIIKADDAEEAKKNRDMLYKKLSEKYRMLVYTDENDFKYYVGGFSPTGGDDAAFVIDVVKYKYEKEVARLFHPYAARLMYGLYEYIKEEF